MKKILCTLLDPSSLSKIINGKRIPEEEQVIEILSRLSTSKTIAEKIISKLRQEQNIKSFKIKKPVNDYNEITQTVFEIISNPIHYTLLELLKLSSFKNDLDYICKKLSISKEVATKVIQNLADINMIKISEGNIKDLTKGFSTHEIDLEKTSDANKSFQIDLLHRSINAVKHKEVKERSHSSIIFASNKDKIYEAKGIIKKFRQSLCDFMEDTEEKDQIYALQVSLFPQSED